MRDRILMVEDNPVNRELLSDWLETEGYEVLAAVDLKAAFAAADSQIPDAVLLDVKLGAEDGLQLARWMRQEARFQRIPIIAVTANAMVAEEERMLQAGCNGYVSKPIDFRVLRELLQRWVAPPGLPGSQSKTGAKNAD